VELVALLVAATEEASVVDTLVDALLLATSAVAPTTSPVIARLRP
jgi:hypothetical protein